jgi:hypothetical protein
LDGATPSDPREEKKKISIRSKNNMQSLLPTNKHIKTFGSRMESGVKPGSDRYDVYTRTLNTENWGGRRVDFQVTNTSLNKLIVGSKCYLNFRCTASKSDDSAIGAADPIELREGAGNLFVTKADVRVAGTTVFCDGFNDITRHWYERLANTNEVRSGGSEEDRFITSDESVFGVAANTVIGSGIRKEAISEGKEFSITRPLTEMAFFGPRDSAIPASLPIVLNTTLNSRPARLFNTDNTIVAAPKLKIIDVELYVYTVELEDAFAEQIKDALRLGTLSAVTDKWASTTLGNEVTAGNTSYRSSDSTLIETVPDVLGVAFLPTDSYNSATPWKGVHPLTTDWLNTNCIDIQAYGCSWRCYRNLGSNADVGSKAVLSRELKEVAGGDTMVGSGRSPINTNVFSRGVLSFFPAVSRSIDEETVVPPKPISLTFHNVMSPNAGKQAQGHVFYKLRHQWNLSTEVGQTMIVK